MDSSIPLYFLHGQKVQPKQKQKTQQTISDFLKVHGEGKEHIDCFDVPVYNPERNAAAGFIDRKTHFGNQ